MKINHLAIWVEDLEKMKAFYETYFQAKSGARYYNPVKHFTSYFLSFSSGCRLELMHSPSITESKGDGIAQHLGLVHLAISVGSTTKVDALTRDLHEAGFKVLGPPRTTGDGYYESVVLDPECNRIEITV